LAVGERSEITVVGILIWKWLSKLEIKHKY